jgi:hypothetical protein
MDQPASSGIRYELECMDQKACAQRMGQKGHAHWSVSQAGTADAPENEITEWNLQLTVVPRGYVIRVYSLFFSDGCTNGC